MQSRSRAVLSRWRYFLVVGMSSLLIVLAACGSDDATDDDAGIAAEPTATEQAAETPTPQPEPTEVPAADDAADADDEATPTAAQEPTPTPEPDESIDDGDTEPTPDVDFAPELAGLTDWRNADPVTLEDLRGEPVILVFWNSI
jgi:hypothetical protein